ncbi:uncharacterized protein LOC134866025 [Eleginops maclovinus]|uniref:uncharacterized protein LOC134866025 n=1 Tax=Eleginops maclovinus TaxID=56733 RepID=UPI00307FF224
MKVFTLDLLPDAKRPEFPHFGPTIDNSPTGFVRKGVMGFERQGPGCQIINSIRAKKSNTGLKEFLENALWPMEISCSTLTSDGSYFFLCCRYRKGEDLLFRYKPETVNYALSQLDSCYRNHTGPGDTDYGARPSPRCFVQPNTEDEVEAMRDKLNVTDIDQVVERLRSVLMEECEALKRLVKHFRGNITQKCPTPCELHNSEPTLAELRELRGAIQSDLELYPSSLTASLPASPLPLKNLKNKFRPKATSPSSSVSYYTHTSIRRSSQQDLIIS